MLEQNYDPTEKKKDLTQSEKIESYLQDLLDYSGYLKTNIESKLSKYIDKTKEDSDEKEHHISLQSEYFNSLKIKIDSIHTILTDINSYLEKFDT